MLLEGRDIIGQAQTGSGKTAAFGLPMLEHVDPSEPEVQALVLTPDARAVHPGHPGAARLRRAQGRRRRRRLRRRPDPLPAGPAARRRPDRRRHRRARARPHPARLADPAQLPLRGPRRGRRDARPRLPRGRRADPHASPPTAARPRSSARRCRRRSARSPIATSTTRSRSRSSRATLTVDSVEQFRVDVKPGDKAEKLVDVLRAERPDQAIVFTRTKIRCDQLFRTLRDRGMNVKALHGDMSQGQRDGVMLAFKGGRLPILVATDVAARGLDISTVTHVVNFDVPDSAPTPTCTASGAPAASGARGAPSPSSSPASSRELEAIERHIGTGDHAVGRGRARRRPRPVAERPRRHSKPHISRDGDEPQAKLVAGVGRAEGVEVADLVHAVTSAAGHRRRGRARRARARALLLPQRPAQRRRARRRRASTARRSTAPTLRLEIARS